MALGRCRSRLLRLEALEDRLLLTAAASTAYAGPVPTPASSSSPVTAHCSTTQATDAPAVSTSASPTPTAPAASPPTAVAAPVRMAPPADSDRGDRDDGSDHDHDQGTHVSPADVLARLSAPPLPPQTAPVAQQAVASAPVATFAAPTGPIAPAAVEALALAPNPAPATAAVEGEIRGAPPIEAGPAAEVGQQAEETPQVEQESREAVVIVPERAVPLVGWLPIDLRPIEEGVDVFFSRLSRLDQDVSSARVFAALAPWLAVAAATAWELARLPRKAGEDEHPVRMDLLALGLEDEP